MTFQEFDKFTEEIFEKVRNMRDTKGREYAGSKDRFDNFNRIADVLELPRNVIWYVYFQKHIDSIRSYVKAGHEFSDEKMQGRVVDAITYLLLFAGMEKEDQISIVNAANQMMNVGQAPNALGDPLSDILGL
jgi:hypothetical protein